MLTAIVNEFTVDISQLTRARNERGMDVGEPSNADDAAYDDDEPALVDEDLGQTEVNQRRS